MNQILANQAIASVSAYGFPGLNPVAVSLFGQSQASLRWSCVK